VSDAPRWWFKLAAAALGVLAAWAIVEAARRAMAPPPLCLACGDCPYVFRLNPARADVGPLGLRDRGYPIPKPRGRKRILILGDSVAYGTGVERDQTFAKLLERRLDGVDVIDSGVPGYSAYNEVEYYRARGRELEPDLVIVAVCLNDVVNPLPHWNLPLARAVPADAVPNPGRRDRGPWRDPPEVEVEGRRWRVFLTNESDLSIQVLLDPESPDWRWLRRMYGLLHEAVARDGAQLALVVFPIRYQLADAYPFSPQAEFARYCAREGLGYLDALPALRQARAEPPFIDPWHLSPRGHEAAAAALEDFLRANPRLLDAATRTTP
jgi:lysophospholipase L1-like esterase